VVEYAAVSKSDPKSVETDVAIDAAGAEVGHAAALVLGPGACPLEMLEIRIGRTELTLKHPGRRGAQRPGCGLRPHMSL
jgi:hypothetical protein